MPEGLVSVVNDMKAKSKKVSRNFDYPEVTPGSIAAKELRTEASKLTGSERENLFKRGMQIIYSGTGAKKTAVTRH